MHERLSGRRTWAVVLASVVSGALLATTVAGQDALDLAEIMRRAHAYVVQYEDHELSTVIARERYQQQQFGADGQRKRARTLLSDYLLFQLPPDESWYALRDVYEVDGRPVSDRAARLSALFAGPRDLLRDRALEIQKESARFNLGRLCRTVNLPTFALRFLRPASRERFEFSKGGDEQVGATSAWVVAYRETERPTFVVTPEGRNVPAQGRFWIEPESGAVFRSEMILGGTRGQATRATITVTYALDPSLGFRVPVEMHERYEDPRREGVDVIVGAAYYEDFRPFDPRSVVQTPAQPASRAAPTAASTVCEEDAPRPSAPPRMRRRGMVPPTAVRP